MRPGPAQRLQETSPALPSSLRGLSAGSFSAFAFGPSSVLALHSSPFRVELYHEDVLVLSANSHQLMHFEQKIDNSAHIEAPPAAAVEQKDRHGGKEVLSYGEDGLAIYTDGTREERDEETPEQDNTLTSEEWQSEEKRARRDSWRESFGGHTDSRPNGPMSVGIDLAFPSSFHLYGIPEHASSLALKSTKVVPGQGGHAHYHEPYRMYNLDVFEYELDEPMALYGNVPMMMGHGLYTKADGSKAAVTAVCTYSIDVPPSFIYYLCFSPPCTIFDCLRACSFSTPPRPSSTCSSPAPGTRAARRTGSPSPGTSTYSSCPAPLPGRCTTSSRPSWGDSSCPPSSPWATTSADGTTGTKRTSRRLRKTLRNSISQSMSFGWYVSTISPLQLQ